MYTDATFKDLRFVTSDDGLAEHTELAKKFVLRALDWAAGRPFVRQVMILQNKDNDPAFDWGPR